MDYSLLSKEELNKIIDSAPVGICITDEQGCYEEVNPAYCSIYGYQREELIGKSFTVVCPEETREMVLSAHSMIISNKSELSDEWEVVKKDGSKISVYSKTTAICGSDGKTKNVTFVIDITARKRYELELQLSNRLLQKQAVTDSLTGLLNQGAIFNTLEVEVIQSKATHQSLCLLMLHLDNLGEINEVHGLSVGDSIVMSVSQVLRSAVRQDDIVGRYAGKQFILLFPDTSLEVARTIAETIVAKIQAISEYDVSLSVSGGLVQLTDETSLDVIRKAENLLHEAKIAGKNQIAC
ncbi:diguanylate cyclase [Heliobacterium undosum]|uniref:Diguanylate cyclase n=1 Tax=Heliomicrobium undosum TaxID=121734 RepID=A0A845L086_9FIRM|nr:sensor domain-containing diguanylate cyclase [Heliomicrobium undosum]MZP28295.1 diguanylate cyclase [Heliomicrobium undosum]